MEQVAGVERVELKVVEETLSLEYGERNLIPEVRCVVAISSGKGGVGKSTVTANLAIALTQMGNKVGILDADILGPSIPTMMGVERPLELFGKRLIPALGHGVYYISFGFFVKDKDPVIWRGPMIDGMLRQLLGDVEWRDLDYLLVDLPPGTGDAQLSLSQLAKLDGAVAVTTPQDVAVADVRKGMAMFEKVEVPILGVIENMSSFVCPECGAETAIFSEGGGAILASEYKVPLFGKLPLDPVVREGGDTGQPIVSAHPESPQAKRFLDLAQALSEEVTRRNLKKRLTHVKPVFTLNQA
ncbi:MAG: ATP-binding protein [Nitrospirae bacterium CG18_big_fil_WC_8_21_14_2_50_70_55]|nr:MAG: ATP-binding protein [Nitrospirae bacterium CG18_big_fil_WC_8_21_14_2_50_70_55]PIU78630.1 MAG: ATP-binding protein [Nitrospirae bacterium CG06_land_8_20_14_3_00_70_43]PJB97320.1 MAG: ATP-binding protein [Nitrospirae bacterium CG_4_9_14_0_8_um_filter_70_14]